ncbi:MAG TPA: tetratricopeptide repeat protein [Nitrospirota bacterium]|nr:tetratricopeptide repeat protein [Nitrospirota bacterium]
MISTRRRANYLAVSIALITFIVYLPSLGNGFINWDDDLYVINNVHIRSFDLHFLKWLFFDFYASYWAPLTWTSHAIDYAVWGLNPWGHHLVNNIFHAVNTFLAVIVTIRLLEAWNETSIKKKVTKILSEREMLVVGGTVGILFGLHPLHVESAVWVAERKDLLCALFFLLSIISYTAYVRSESNRASRQELSSRFFDKYYLITIGFFILALFSKPMAVSLPAVLLILDWYPFQIIESSTAFRKAIINKIPFIALSLGMSIIIICAHKAGGAIAPLAMVPLPSRAIVSAHSLIAYFGMMIWPLNLLPVYTYPTKTTVLSFKYLSSIIFVIAITVVCFVKAKNNRLWLAAWSYYIITLAPVLGVIQVGPQAMADRFTYLPSLGPFFLIGLSAAWFSKHGFAGTGTGAPVKGVIIVAAFAVCAAMSYVTYKQIGIWKNGIELWTYVIDRDPTRAFFAYNNRGVCYEKAGLIDKAVDDYKEAIVLNPGDDQAYFNLGVIYQRAGAQNKAIEYYNDSLAINPNRAEAFHNRGVIYFQNRQPGRALDDFDRAIELNPEMVIAYYNRATLYLRTNRQDLALFDFRKACDLGSEDACKALASGELSFK